jgi:hypothetical protein
VATLRTGVDATGNRSAGDVVARTERDHEDDKQGSDHHELLEGDGTLVS